jgi:hypothetical protein
MDLAPHRRQRRDVGVDRELDVERAVHRLLLGIVQAALVAQHRRDLGGRHTSDRERRSREPNRQQPLDDLLHGKLPVAPINPPCRR